MMSTCAHTLLISSSVFPPPLYLCFLYSSLSVTLVCMCVKDRKWSCTFSCRSFGVFVITHVMNYIQVSNICNIREEGGRPSVSRTCWKKLESECAQLFHHPPPPHFSVVRSRELAPTAAAVNCSLTPKLLLFLPVEIQSQVVSTCILQSGLPIEYSIHVLQSSLQSTVFMQSRAACRGQYSCSLEQPLQHSIHVVQSSLQSTVFICSQSSLQGSVFMQSRSSNMQSTVFMQSRVVCKIQVQSLTLP